MVDLSCAVDMGTSPTSIDYRGPLQCFIDLFMNGIVIARPDFEVWMCTGDHRAAAEAVAKDCGIDKDRVVAGLLKEMVSAKVA